LAQTFLDYEIILIDDGSRDNCGAICDRYAAKDGRIRVFHKENCGVSAARNYGLDMAKGKYITFVDSDDWIHPDFLMRGITACREYDFDLYCSGFARIYPDGSQRKSIVSQPILGYTDDLSQEAIIDLLENNYIASSVVKLIRHDVISHFRFDTQMVWGEDLRFVFTLLGKHHKIYAAPRADYFYRVGHTSATASTSLVKCQNIAQIYEDLYSFITKRDFGLGAYSRFIDRRCREDLMYAEQLVLNGGFSITKKIQMLNALMKLRDQILFMEDPVLVHHIKLYGKFPGLLLLRSVLSKLNRRG
jgi:glycosyltransferase involved in cell wall biosynthesis